MIEWWNALWKAPVITAVAKRSQTTSFRKSSDKFYYLQRFNFAGFQLIEDYGNCTLRKGSGIAAFVEWFIEWFEKAFLINFISAYSNWLKDLFFARFMLIEDYEQGALRKELIVAPFVERFETATLRKPSW